MPKATKLYLASLAPCLYGDPRLLQCLSDTLITIKKVCATHIPDSECLQYKYLCFMHLLTNFSLPSLQMDI